MEKIRPKSPLEFFFSLGDRVTRGDPEKKADFDYYMLWIIFLAFFGIFFGNIKNFIETTQFQFLGWALFGLAIMCFQYFNLKMSWQMRKARKKAIKDGPQEEKDIESIDDMLKDFKPKEKTKDGLPTEQPTTKQPTPATEPATEPRDEGTESRNRATPQ